MKRFIDLNDDQNRETTNTRQRFAAWREVSARAQVYRGSMVWSHTNGHEYLLQSSYTKNGKRKQVSLGPRSAVTEQIKVAHDAARLAADARVASLRPVMSRQAAINRALGLGRVPVVGARIIRALDAAGILGAGFRVVGTNAIFAFEAAAGVHVDAGITTTEDIDLLFESRARLTFIADGDMEEASLLRILQRADTSFERSGQTFRAVNRDGYTVDLIKPLRDPPWGPDPVSLGIDPRDLEALEITGLQWLENATPFEAIVIDQRGEALRMVTTDPRVFAAHKWWLSKRADREPLKRRRDAEQARCVAALVRGALTYLPYHPDDLRMLPTSVFDDAAPLFTGAADEAIS